MSWTLIYFLFVVFMFALFSIFNLRNTCNVSFFFYEFKDIPVYTAALFSFILGSVLAFPFLIRRKKKGKEDVKLINDVNTIELKNQNKKSFFSRVFKNKDTSDEEKK